MDSNPGTYVLVLKSSGRKHIRVGKNGRLEIDRGHYLYVGSAFGPGGLLSRVSRHCREEKPKRWHIDFLRPHARLVEVWYAYGPERLEHRWAKVLERVEATVPVPGFGSSDCRCGTHLFCVAQAPALPGCTASLPGAVRRWYCGPAG